MPAAPQARDVLLATLPQKQNVPLKAIFQSLTKVLGLFEELNICFDVFMYVCMYVCL